MFIFYRLSASESCWTLLPNEARRDAAAHMRKLTIFFLSAQKEFIRESFRVSSRKRMYTSSVLQSNIYEKINWTCSVIGWAAERERERGEKVPRNLNILKLLLSPSALWRARPAIKVWESLIIISTRRAQNFINFNLVYRRAELFSAYFQLNHRLSLNFDAEKLDE